jgi:hypothetical protein
LLANANVGGAWGAVIHIMMRVSFKFIIWHQSRNAYSIAWNFTELSRHTLEDAAIPTWISNQEFVYGGQPSGEDTVHLSLINVETQTISVWTGRDDIMMPRTILPDLSRGFDYKNVLNLETSEILSSLEETGDNIWIYPYESGDLWSPNSAYFLAIDDLGARQNRLLLFSRDGEYLGHILTAARLNAFSEVARIIWSPNGEKFLFRTWIEHDGGLSLSDWYVVDIEQKNITNLCDDFIAAWSPDGEYLALNWDSQLSILDSNFNHYLIRENFRYGVLGWRAAE